MSFVPQTIYRESREIKKKKINYPYKTDKVGLSFFAVQRNMWDLNTLTRDWPWVPCIGSMKS